MAEAQKDTIYIDIDDEITSIIDKVRQSKHKIVALVLPKRATVLQSIVNMKLLKRAADGSSKRIVLITSEAGLLPLAGAVKLYVAKTLQSKPVIPEPPDVPSADVALEEAEPLEGPEPEQLDTSKPVGELAGDKPKPSKKVQPEESIDLEDEPEDTPEETPSKDQKKSDKKLSVPDFNKFRKRIFLAAGGFILLIILWYVAYFVLPKATITIKTDTLTSNIDLAFTANTAIKDFDQANKVIPAESRDTTKTDTVKVAATGKKNVGEKATGTAQFYNCNQNDKLSDTNRVVPAGTIISSGGSAFVTSSDVTVMPSGFNGNNCKSDKPSNAVNVVAQNSGDQYNLSSRSYSVSGFSTISAVGSAMAGGTTKNVTVVSDQDIDTAKQQLADKSKTAAQTELTKKLEDDSLFAIGETISNKDPSVTSAPKVGEEAGEVTVTSTVVYTLLGIKKENLHELVTEAAKKDIDTAKQKITDDGLGKAVFRVTEKKSATEQKITVQSSVSTGAQIDEAQLKKEIAGKKRGDVQQTISSLPGVKEVTVNYSPFWVYKTPKKASSINFVYQKP